MGDTGIGTTTNLEKYLESFPGPYAGSDDCLNRSRCDTEKYTEDINAMALCGYDDWRLPDQFELMGIVSSGHYAPAIDENYFPYAYNNDSARYLSSSPAISSSVFPGRIWAVEFSTGSMNVRNVYEANYVRLVRP